MRRLIGILAVAVLLPAAPAHADTVRVYLLRGEQFQSVTRTVPPGAGRLRASLTALFAGPTAAERRAGFSTAISDGMALRRAAVAGDVVTLRLTRGFATARPDIQTARLGQLVYTASAATGFTRYRVRMPGFPVRKVDRADFAPPAFSEPTPPQERRVPPPDPAALQARLAALAYLPLAAVTGVYDYRTMQAVLAFQSWEGLQRDGVVGPQTMARLATASAPVPMSKARGRHLEIYRKRGVVLLLDGAKLVRAIHTSTGIGGDDPALGTPPGRWRIYRKEVRSWSVPYKTWLPYASYWNAGWALHGYPDVPVQPASHGCARLPLPEMKLVYDFAVIGTPVLVV